MRKVILAAACFAFAFGPARADYFVSTPTVAPPNAIIQVIKSGTLNGGLLPWMNMVDATGMPIGTAGNPLSFNCITGCSGGGGGGSVFGPTPAGTAAANPPVLIGGTVDGTATGAMSAWKVNAGIGFINCANCSGSGISVPFAGAIGSVGTPGGFKDGSGNFQPLLGDVTNGQWVNIKASVPIGVTGTFWPYTLGQQVSGASVPVVLPAAQVTALTPPTSVGISGTLPAFAATPTVNIGTAPTIAVTGTFFQATQPVSAASLPLPAGAATQTTSAAILTALGSPFQAGASIGNTSFAATQATASALNATVVGTGTFAVQLSGATNNINNIAGTVSLPTGAATSALQTTGNTSLASILTATPTITTWAGGTLGAMANYGTSPGAVLVPGVNAFVTGGTLTATQATGTNLHMVCDSGCSSSTSPSFGSTFPLVGTPFGFSQGGNFVAATGTSGNLNVQCANCSGSGVSTADGAAFTAGSSLFAGAGGIVQTTATSNPVTAGDQGLFQMTANRALFTNLRNSSGVEIGTAAAPVQISLANTAANGTALLVTGTGGTFPITAASLPLPTGAATQTTLASVLTTLGSPFQAGGSIGNTSFAATQATASALNATVVGTGTFAVQSAPTSAAAWGINTLGSTTSGQSGQLALGAVTTAAPTYTTAQSNALSLTTTGALRVDGSAATQPVSLTSTTITGSVAVTGTFWQATQPISAASLPLPALAATSTKQSDGSQKTQIVDGSGNVIAATSNALNVNCANCSGGSNASVSTTASAVPASATYAGMNVSGNLVGLVGTANGLKVDGSAVTQPVSNAGTFAVQATLQASGSTAVGTVNPTTIGNWGLAASTQNGTTPTNAQLVMGQFNTSPTTITSGNVSPLQLDASGNVKVNIVAGASSGAVAQGSTTSGQTGGLIQAAATTAAPTYTTATTNPLSMDLAGNLRVTVAAAIGLAQGSTTSGQTGSMIMAAVTTGAPTYTTAQTSPLSLDTSGNLRITGAITTLPALVAGSAIVGKFGIDQTTQGTTNGVVQLASTGGGTSHAHVVAAASNNSTLVSTGAHNLYAAQMGNNSATIAYLKIYDKATAPTCGTDTPIKTLIIPASTSGAGSNVNIDIGASVTLGLGYCITGGIADTDNTSVAATSIVVNVDYK